MKIGLDLDGVIIDHRRNKLALASECGFRLEPWQTNSNLMKDYLPGDVYEALKDRLYAEMTLEAPAVDNALETLGKLDAELYIVSARRPATFRFAQEWLTRNRIHDHIPAERIYFCGAGSEKRGICERLRVSAFLDDKINVLEQLPSSVRRYLFDEDGVAPKLDLGDRIQVVRSWEDFICRVATHLH